MQATLPVGFLTIGVVEPPVRLCATTADVEIKRDAVGRVKIVAADGYQFSVHFFRRRRRRMADDRADAKSPGLGRRRDRKKRRKEVALAVAVQTRRGPVWQGANNIYAQQRQAASVKRQRINSPWNAAESEGTGLQVAGAKTGYAAVWFANAKAAPASWQRERPDCCGGVCNGHATKPTQRTSVERESSLQGLPNETTPREILFALHFSAHRNKARRRARAGKDFSRAGSFALLGNAAAVGDI